MLRLRFVVPLVAALPVLSLACGDDTTSTGSGGSGGSGTGGGAACQAAEGPPECTVITQASAASTLSSVYGVGFPYAPSAGGPAPEIVTVSPNFMGAFGPGTYELTGPKGDFVVFASEDAVTDLINRDPTAMDGRIFAATAGVAKVTAAPSYGTQFQGRVTGTLQNVVFRELNDSLEVIDGGDCMFLACGEYDAAGADASCDAPADPASAPSGGACLADYASLGHQCNPVTNEGCMPGEICDLSGYFECLPATGTEAAVCGACDLANDQFCGAGLTCDSYADTGKCFRYCCTDEDCGTGNTCVAFGALYVGVCMSGAP